MKAAIYSRKSIFTGKGDSIENQIELCKEYGQRLGINDFIIYEDEGFSGGNTNRPDFQQLLKDVEKKKFDVLICYRLDRISRNVADFSTTLEKLQKYNVDFVSIKEQFDTTTPMGRAMVYISSVFAQLERETIAERVKDNMMQLAKQGRWLGGNPPLGFSAERITYYDHEMKEREMSKLIPIEEELQQVKRTFELYIQLKSATQVAKQLAKEGFRGKRGAIPSSTKVIETITNPVYVKSDKDVEEYLKSLGVNVFGDPNGNGYLTYNKTDGNTKMDKDMNEWIMAISNHKGVVSSDIFIKSNKIYKENNNGKIRATKSEAPTLLNGILKCDICGGTMFAKKGKISPKTGRHNYYYICSRKEKHFGISCDNKNINAEMLDNMIISELKSYDREYIKKHLANVIKTNKKTNDFKALKLEIAEKEKAINNLIEKMALTTNDKVIENIIKVMERMQNEVDELKESLILEETTSNDIETEIMNMELLMQMLDNVIQNIDYMDSIPAKRRLLQTVIKEVRWNGKSRLSDIDLVWLKKN